MEDRSNSTMNVYKLELDAVIKTVIPARKCLPLDMKHPVT